MRLTAIAPALAVAAAVFAAGCTSAEEDRAADQEKLDAAATAAARATAQADRRARRDSRRAARLRAFYRDIGGTKRWLVEDVQVTGDDVIVLTGLYPKASNEPGFTGTCTSLIDYEPWINAVVVEGQDDAGHASWFAGDLACDTMGLG